jgi:glucokinase
VDRLDRFAVGLDLGGTDLKFGLVRDDGSLEGFARRPSRTGEDADAPLLAIVEAVSELRARAGDAIVGAGLGCPGVIEPGSGRMVDRTAHLPHWHDLPLGEVVAARIGLEVAVDNDANLAALAEHRLGAARGARVSMTITLGTGIGCGIVIDGRVYRGARGGAGELGHVPLGRTGRPCRCGVPGCVEPEASGSGLETDARELGLEPPDAATVFARAAQGDGRAAAVVERFADRLGAAIATAVALLDPDVVVIGGGVARARDLLMAPLRLAVQRYALPSHLRGLAIRAAGLGEAAGVIGAGLLAWERAAGDRG